MTNHRGDRVSVTISNSNGEIKDPLQLCYDYGVVNVSATLRVTGSLLDSPLFVFL